MATLCVVYRDANFFFPLAFFFFFFFDRQRRLKLPLHFRMLAPVISLTDRMLDVWCVRGLSPLLHIFICRTTTYDYRTCGLLFRLAFDILNPDAHTRRRTPETREREKELRGDRGKKKIRMAITRNGGWLGNIFMTLYGLGVVFSPLGRCC